MTYEFHDDEDDLDYECVLTWNFDWSELKLADVDRISGSIYIKSLPPSSKFSSTLIEVDLNDPKQTLKKNFYSNIDLSSVVFEYEFCLHFNPGAPYKKMFLPSDETDAILVVDGKKIHVCKAVSVRF